MAMFLNSLNRWESAELNREEAGVQWAGVVPKAPRKGAHRRKRERRPLPGISGASGRSRHAWLEGKPTLDFIVRWTMRRARSPRLSRRGGGHGLDLPRAERGLFGARPADHPLYKPRRPLFPHRQARARSTAAQRPRPGAGAIGRRARAPVKVHVYPDGSHPLPRTPLHRARRQPRKAQGRPMTPSAA